MAGAVGQGVLSFALMLAHRANLESERIPINHATDFQYREHPG